MTTLINRNQSRDSIQAVIDYVEADNFHERDYIQLYNRHAFLLEQWRTFAENSNELRAEAADAIEEEEHAAIYTRYEPLYLEVRSIMETRMNQLHPDEQNQPQQLTPEYMQMLLQQQQSREIVVKLDESNREIQNTWGEFGGNLTKWRGFCDLFTDRVHNDNSIAPVRKFRLLKSSLKGRAAAALGDWELSDANYEEAWKRLKELYEQNYQTGFKLVQRLTKLNKIERASGDNLQALSNIANDVYRQLRALRYPVENLDFFIIFMIHDLLDEETGVKWNLERKTDYPTLTDFLGFLDRQARALTTFQIDNKREIPKGENNRKRFSVAERAKFNAKRAKSDEAQQSTPDRFKCVICKEAHYIYKCDKFLRSSLSERRQMARLNKLCHNCLKLGHLAKECLGKECPRCSVKHNRLLCSENPLNKQVPETKAQVMTRGARKRSTVATVTNTSAVGISDQHTETQ